MSVASPPSTHVYSHITLSIMTQVGVKLVLERANWKRGSDFDNELVVVIVSDSCLVTLCRFVVQSRPNGGHLYYRYFLTLLVKIHSRSTNT